MLQHTLDILASCSALAEVMVVSADERILNISSQHGVEIHAEMDSPGLNTSLQRASQEVSRRGGEAVLVIPADLPCLQHEDIQKMLDQAVESPVVVIASDRHQQGTNALLVAPPGTIPFSFGRGSLQKHMAAADQAGVAVYRVKSRGLELDVDNADDLAIATSLSCM
jgi:2-phospho-L-lactate guanylyltransferase